MLIEHRLLFLDQVQRSRRVGFVTFTWSGESVLGWADLPARRTGYLTDSRRDLMADSEGFDDRHCDVTLHSTNAS